MINDLILNALNKHKIFSYFWNDDICTLLQTTPTLTFEPSEYVGVYKYEFQIPLYFRKQTQIDTQGIENYSVFMNVRLVSLTDTFCIRKAIENIDQSSPKQAVFISINFNCDNKQEASMSFNLGSSINSDIKATSDFIAKYHYIF